MTELFVLIIIVLTAVGCSLVGNFLVLRKLSLMGDAISHAVLPGIVVAFLFVGHLDSPLFFLMAVFFAVLMAFFIQWITDRVSISRESVIGIVFTALFALGVLMLVQFADNVHLDQDAVLFGSVEFSALNRFEVFGVDIGPRSLWMMGTVFLVNLVLILIFYKEFKLTTFDPGLARSLGFSVKKMHYLLMIMTAITVVAAFEAVGAILVVALLVVPAATAYLLSQRLVVMMFLSAFFAAVAAVAGFWFALYFDVSTAGSVAMMAGLGLMIVVIANVSWKLLRGRV